MLREMVVAVGEPADPQRIERSRQAVMDLGLFRSVTVRQEPVPDGVRLVFVVKEKWYILPLPRIGYDTDKHLSLGGQLTWYNVAGLNQTARVHWVRSGAGSAGRGPTQTLSLDYDIPFLDDTAWALSLSGGRSRGPVTDATDGTEYNETTEYGSAVFTRALSGPPFSQGWHAGAGLRWQREDTDGLNAPVPFGHATAVVGVAGYRDLRYHVYSEAGSAFNINAAVAVQGVASDYSYDQLSMSWARYLEIGDTPYQSLNFFASGGVRFQGPPRGDAFYIGGRSTLRAYRSDAFEGNGYFRVAAEYLHPVHWDWLRALVVLEAGNAWPQAYEPDLRRIHTSLGLGLRLRVTWLVNFEVEAGVAVPLDDRAAPRFFGGRV
jgi:outer membrane protein assembly factor BamA